MTETVAAPTETAEPAGAPARPPCPTTSSPASSSDPLLRPARGVHDRRLGHSGCPIPLPPAPAARSGWPPAGTCCAAGCPCRCPPSSRPGRAPRRNDDQFYPFRPGSDYVWLTGDQTPGGVLLLDPGSAAGDVLFLLPPSGRDNGEFYSDSSARRAVGRAAQRRWKARAAALGIDLPAAGRAAGGAGRAGQALVSRSFDAEAEQQVDRRPIRTSTPS